MRKRACDFCFKPAVTHRRLLRYFFLRTYYCKRHDVMFVVRLAQESKPVHVPSAEVSFPVHPELADMVRNVR